MTERPDEPLVEVEAGRISRPSSTRFFFRADDDGEEPPQDVAPPEDWRALRLREVLAQRAERLADREETTFRLPWSELLQAVTQVLQETGEGADVDRGAATLIDFDSNEETRVQPPFSGDDSETLCTPAAGNIAAAGGGEETVVQSSPELVSAQQEAAYLEGKLARAEQARQQLAERLANAEEAAEAAALQLEQAEQALTRSQREGEATRSLADQLRLEIKQLEASLEAGEVRLAAAEEATAEVAAERDVALVEAKAAQSDLDEARTGIAEAQAGVAEARAGQEGAEALYEAARSDSASVRKRWMRTRQDLEARVDGLEEELLRRTAGHERERATLLEDLLATERVLRELFGKLPEPELRGWVPGLEREPWNEETAIRHLVCLLERMDELRGERRQARLLPVPDFEHLRARIESGRAEAPAAHQPRLARLKRAVEHAESRFEALREAHLTRQAKLGELVELNAVVAQALAHERELGALGL